MTDSTNPDPSLIRHVRSSRGSDQQLAEFFGPDLMNQLATAWRGPETTETLFRRWHVAVTKPLGIAPDRARGLFTGQISIDDFVGSLSDELLETFVEKFPTLQGALPDHDRAGRCLAVTSSPDQRALHSAIARRLLREALPKMQPSALKHEYLTSVANAMNHPVATVPLADSAGATRVIAWSDLRRRLPLVLIIDTDQTVRHAFVPKLPGDADLVKELQAEEDAWAADHDTVARPLHQLLKNNTANDINRYGLPADYLPPPRYTNAHREQIFIEGWYRTRPLPPELEINHLGRPDLRPASSSRDADKVETNVTHSINMNTDPREPRVARAPVKVSDGHLAWSGSLEFEPENDDNEIEFF